MDLPSNEKDGGKVGKEQAAAKALRDRIAKRRKESVPDFIKVAQYAWPQLVGAFSLIFGDHATLISRGEYERRFLRGGPTPGPLDVHPSWMTRALPGKPPAGL